MPGGIWSPTEEKVRPGLYINFKAAAAAQIQGGPRGIVAMPVKADWGPVRQFVEITGEKDLLDIFGTGGTTKLVKRALKASTRYKPSKILVYRIASGTAAKAEVSLGAVIKLIAKYEGVRGNGFKVTVANNAVDAAKKDIKLYEGTTFIKAYTAAPNDIDGFVDMINADTGALITATKLGAGSVADVASSPFAGGDSGAVVTNSEYVNAMAAFEPRMFNVFVLDGVSDSTTISSAKEWVKRLRDEGKKVTLVIGGSTADDQTLTTGNTRSVGANHEGIVNVVIGTISGSDTFNSAETACQIAGVIAGTPINKSTTYKVLEDVDDVTKRLTDSEIRTSLISGSLVLVADTDPETQTTTVKIEQGINTLTTFTTEKSKKFSKIRTIRTLDAISDDITRTATKNYIGELDNNDDGRAALISAIKLYLETLANANAVSKDFITEVDKFIVSEEDKVYLNTNVMTIDSIEKIFNTVNVR